MKLHELTKPHRISYEEAAVWGKCPACGAPPGESCNPDVGIHMGRTQQDGAHLGRLQAAPRWAKLVECRPGEEMIDE